jgi:hypothetical protein
MSGRHDILHVGGRFEDLVEIAAGTDREAVLKAAKAWEREEASPDHMADLFVAVARLRGPYILRLEAEVNAYRRLAGDKATAEGQAEHLARCRDEMRDLLRADIERVTREARG